MSFCMTSFNKCYLSILYKVVLFSLMFWFWILYSDIKVVNTFLYIRTTQAVHRYREYLISEMAADGYLILPQVFPGSISPVKRLTGPLAFGLWSGAIEDAGGRGVMEKPRDFYHHSPPTHPILSRCRLAVNSHPF